MASSAPDTHRSNSGIYYILAAIVGALTGALGSYFHLLVARLYNWSMHLPELLGIGGPLLYVIMAIFSAAMICGAVALVRNFSPEASGSGVQEIEGAMEGLREVRWKRVLPVKFIGGIMALGAGLVGGREGPTIHMGASIAKALCSLSKMEVREAQALLAAGGAAGLAAAFNAPLASIIFIIEETRSEFPYSTRTYSAVIIACALSGIVATAITGNIPYMALTAQEMPLSFMPAFIVLGLILGVIGAAFNKAVMAGLDISSLVSQKVSAYLLPALLGIIIGPLMVIYPAVTGGGESLVGALVNNPLPILTLCLIAVVRFFMSAASYSVGAPAGIFAPILGLAATISICLAALLELFITLPPGALAAFAVAGMAGLFAGTVRAPLVGVVLVAELTGAYTLIVPTILTVFVASVTAAALGGRPIYEMLLERTLRLAKGVSPSTNQSSKAKSE